MEETIRLFDDDSYIKDFTATVIESYEEGGKFVTVLDRTAFFPEEGGQSCDVGTIGTSFVSHVEEREGIILHYTDKKFTAGETVSGAINFEERFRKMQNHTGEHILCGIAHTLRGAENVGFHLSEEYVRVDLDIFLDKDQLAELEAKANFTIAENHRVIAWYPDPSELDATEFRSKNGIRGKVRLVKIEGVDICACCAPHVQSTGEIGVLKIIDAIKYKGGTRLEIVCGSDAVKMFIREHKLISELASSYSVKRDELKDAVYRQKEEVLSLTHKLRKAEKDLMLNELSKLEPTDANFCFFYEDADPENVREFLNGAVAKCGKMCAGFIGDDCSGYRYIIRSENIDLKNECHAINKAINGNGGGSSVMIQGRAAADRETIERFFK